jgi:hypothetical protein
MDGIERVVKRARGDLFASPLYDSAIHDEDEAGGHSTKGHGEHHV